MTLNIGRKGFVWAGLQSGAQVPAAGTDYLPFSVNTLHGVQEQLPVNTANTVRDITNTTVPGKQYSMGEIDMLLDSKLATYFLVGAMGSVSTSSLGSSTYQHTITRNNANTPQYLTLTNDRGVDREIFADVTVDQIDVEAATDLATVKAKLIGNFPQTTTSGTATTASGSVYSFRNSSVAFGATVAAAASAPNLKPHDFKMSLNNNAETVHGHGSGLPRSINVKGFDVNAEFQLYFENTTDRDAYYAQSKQALVWQFNGNGIGGGRFEQTMFRFYQVSFSGFELETGLDNYFAEKVKVNGEFDNSNNKSLDILVQNNKSLYI